MLRLALEDGIITLSGASSKNKEPRPFPFHVLPELEALLKRQRRSLPTSSARKTA